MILAQVSFGSYIMVSMNVILLENPVYKPTFINPPPTPLPLPPLTQTLFWLEFFAASFSMYYVGQPLEKYVAASDICYIAKHI